jgi:hypothetical protein
MITYSFSNDENTSTHERQQAKADWLDKLGKFKDEFDEKNGFVNINFAMPLDDDRYFSFNLSEPHDLSDFINRFNEWQRAGRPI